MKIAQNPFLEGGVSMYTGGFGFAKKRRHRNSFYITGSYDCKEAFSRRFGKKTKYFTISHPKEKFPQIFKFIEEIERILDLNKKDRLKLIKFQNVDYCTLIQTSKWWRYNGIRREFLAVMLKNAVIYSGVYNFDTILRYGYARTTGLAVNKFLKGYTHYFGYVGGVRGWHHTFGGKRNMYRMFCKPSIKRFFKLLDY
jgi:hypothetical protein